MAVVHIRAATPLDLDNLRHLYRRSSLYNPGDRDALLAHPEVLVWPDAAIVEGRTRVASLADGGIVGFVAVLITATSLEVDDLFVDPDWMGRGIGRELISDCVTAARQRGLGRVEVTANTHALGFYEKMGFREDFQVETQFGPAPRMHRDVPR